MSQLSFGAPPGLGGGDACGRCFHLVANYDPYDPGYKVPSKGITVKVTDLCPVQGNEEWCGQTTQNPLNQHNASTQYVVASSCSMCQSACSIRFFRSFDLCVDSGANEFFPSGHGALTGHFVEVSCSEHWDGSSAGSPQWNTACLAPDDAPLWPSVSCGNKGTELSLPTPRDFF